MGSRFLALLCVLASLAAGQQICNASVPTDNPLLGSPCIYCDPATNNGCTNGGTCTLSQIYGNRTIMMCSCSFGRSPPQCVRAVAPRLCNPANASDTPSLSNPCSFCFVNAPDTVASGCFNGGTCYYQPTTGLPIPGIAVCGCTYGYAPPTCSRAAPAKRICDPTLATDVPPACEYCKPDPALSTSKNGCTNLGFCSVQNVTGNAALPPNFQTPLCTCQLGMVPPNCRLNFFQALGSPETAEVRWFYFSIYLVLMLLSLLVCFQHVYLGTQYKFTTQNKTKLVGSFLVAMSCMCQVIRLGINPLGATFGFPTVYDLTSTLLCSNLGVALLCICVAINTCNWISIGVVALTPMRSKSSDGWILPAKILFWTVAISEVTLAIFFACYQHVMDLRNVFQFFNAAWLIAMLLFSIVSGAIVLATIASIETSDPRLLRRTAVQIILLCFVELVAAVLLIVISTIRLQGASFSVVYGISTIFPQLVQWMLVLALLAQFRIAVWQLKEIAARKPNTMSGGSQRTGVSRRSADSAETGASENREMSADVRGSTAASASKPQTQPEVEQGLITL